MQALTRISIAVVCALGVTVAIAQTIQPRGATPTQARSPLQTAQAQTPGGAASGASTAGATAAVGGTTVGTVAFVAVGVAAVASTGGSTVTHNP
jgi:hypothetical protein